MSIDMNLMDRIPPYSVEAEQSVLGSMLLDREIIPGVSGILSGEDFYQETHKEIFEAVMDLFQDSQPIDLITVSEQLKRRGSLEKIGDIEYLSNMATSVPTTANAQHYAQIVEEKSLLRKLIHATGDITVKCYQGMDDTDDILSHAEKKIFDISQERNRTGLTLIRDVLDSTFSRLEELYNNQSDLTGVPSGFSDLDKKTAGFQPSDLILIAARPAMGKTSFALNLAQYAAVHQQVPVVVFSLEMSKEQLVTRMLACEAMIELDKMRTGKLEDDDWKKIAQALGPISHSPIYIDDNANTSVMEILSKCRRLKLEKGLGLIVIDYLQLMQSRKRIESRQQEISEISRSLKIMAKELNTPVIALSQLSRAPEQRSDHRPVLSDLRESGAIEQDADLVMFLYRDDYYHEDSEKKNIAEVIIAKHRNGSTGAIDLAWISQFTKFGNLDKHV